MANAVKKYQEARTKMAAARRQIEKTAKSVFKEMSAEFFENNPAIRSFGWNQYTPYWNDGNTCTFNANTEYPFFTFTAKDGRGLQYDENMGELTELGTAVKDEEADVEYSPDETIDYTPYEKEINKHSKAVTNFLGEFSEDDLQTMFGDHQQITVTPKKVKIEDYEHD